MDFRRATVTAGLQTESNMGTSSVIHPLTASRRSTQQDPQVSLIRSITGFVEYLFMVPLIHRCYPTPRIVQLHRPPITIVDLFDGNFFLTMGW